MPELPELEVVREVLTRRLAGRQVEGVAVSPKGGPIVVRDLTGEGFAETLSGVTIASLNRRGKFLIFELLPARLWLAVNPKLAGRFQLCPPGAKKAGPVHVTLRFTQPEEELRYVDSKQMGQLYLTRDLAAVPGMSDLGPDALEIPFEDFREGLRRYHGEIKGILTRGAFVAGIGNAYADEILWHATLHPYRKRRTLSPDEVERLHPALRECLLAAIEEVRRAMGEEVHLKPRDFFAVHLRGGQPCPRCGTTISQIGANQRITSFCRSCQPGGLIRGM
ncbi:MAG TPA: DNA-formamidopyrimidine glycosylase family protein [Anaerolineales bacterium]|nr:DNA-formamidopyrimidine glycosylase family protein [Anaerolineales bacterium]